MALRSVLEIDVDDDAFKAFQASFDKYNKAVGRLPGEWGKVNAATEQTGNSFVSMTAALMAQAEMLRRSGQEAEKVEQVLVRTQRTMHGLSRTTREFGGHLLSATNTLLRWTGVAGIVGSLTGLLSIGGISHLADSASRTYRSSLGYAGPTTPSQVLASGAYGGILDSRSVLSQITGMLTTAEGKGALFALGIKPESFDKGAGALMPEFLHRLQGRAKQTPEGNFGDVMQGYGLSGVSDLALVLKHMSPRELMQLTEIRIKNERELAEVTKGVLEKWVKLQATIDLAGTKIQSAFIIGLEPLVPFFVRITDAFSNAVIAFGKSDTVKKWLGELAEGLEHVNVELFVQRLGEGALKLVDFAATVTSLLGKLANFMGWLDIKMGVPSNDNSAPTQQLSRGFLSGAAVGGVGGGFLFGAPGLVLGAGLGGLIGAYNSGAGGGQPQHNPTSGWFRGRSPQIDPTSGRVRMGNTSSFQNVPLPQGEGVDPSITRGVQFFMERGLTREQSIGLVGRMSAESGRGVRLDPLAENPSSHAYGIAQWLGSRKPAALATNGDLEAQLRLVWSELENNEGNANALQAIRATTTVGDSARAAERFERALNPAFTERAARIAEGLAARLSNAPAPLIPRDVPPPITLVPPTNSRIERWKAPEQLPGAPERPPLPLGMPYNSRGEPYSPTLLTMSAKEKETAAARSAEWKRATARRDTSMFGTEEQREATFQHDYPDLWAKRQALRVRAGSGIKVTVEHDVGGGAPAAGAVVAQ